MASKKTKTNLKSKWLFIAVAFVALFVIFYAALPKHTIAPTQTTQIVSTTPDPATADWQTYTDSKYGFELKHPPSWREEIRCQGGSNDDDYVCFKNTNFKEGKAGAYLGGFEGILVMIDGKNGGFFASKISDFCNSNELEKITDCKKVTINGLTAWQRIENSFLKRVVIIKDDKPILSFQIYYSSGYKDEALRRFNQILSTFKFTDSEGAFCGGFAGKACPEGYTCRMDGNYPDAGGKCVKQ